MTPDEADKKPEPEFDPATWTPDQPWPKGYYKPVPGIQAAMERIDRAAGKTGDNAGFRAFIWGAVTLVLQLVGFAAVGAGAAGHYGLLHTIVRAVTPLPVFLLFALLLPAALYAGIVGGDRIPFRRGFAFGLLWSLAVLSVILLLALLALRR